MERYDVTGTDRPRFWVGVQNQDSVARAVCVVSIRYVLEERSGRRSSAGVEDFEGLMGLPPCPHPAQSHLVRPNETLFVLVRVPLDDQMFRTGRLSILAVLVDHCSTSTPCAREATDVSIEVPQAP